MSLSTLVTIYSQLKETLKFAKQKLGLLCIALVLSGNLHSQKNLRNSLFKQL